VSYVCADKDEPIHWYCPVCSDNGMISGWQNSSWDGLANWDGLAAPTTVPSARPKRSQGL
jgi:hypothetical protein